ncbi:acyl-CoA dehydrogenase family protein [Prauserella alba]|uniref:Acyl-CoA dehydrogenase family protein n=1 Tax=Prauserella alba TaxID=176898 RepID=A0ABN1VTU8_9PSEU|nr:acyl-CoA dehydrogenase family protein [Prauserella alba]MCP2179898.1 Acyl-CoA dehydrogenase [Prauserella alba]
MDFTPDEMQRTAAELAAGALARATGGDDGRAEGGAVAWRRLADAGLLALVVPESLGGDGLGVAETAAVVREVGRAGSHAPAWAALTLGVAPLVHLGASERCAGLLRAVSAGDAVVTAALHEPSAPMVERPATVATATGATGTVGAGPAETWRLDGVKTAVPLAAEAERILVPATVTGGGTAVFLLDPSAPGVHVTPAPTASGTPEAVLRLDGAATGPPLDEACGPGGAVRVLHRHALAGAAAFGDGLLAGALALTTQHLGTREQFGRPLATFQAVAQQVADVYVAARTVHLAAESAVWRLATGRDADADLDVAAYWLAEQAPPAMATCHHLHGGIGLDETYPLHRYSSLLKDLVRGIGGPSLRLDRVGALTGGAA